MNIKYISNYQKLIADPSNPIYKIIVFSNAGPKILKPLAQKFERDPEIIVTSSGERNIEINSIKAQKGIAKILCCLLEHSNEKCNGLR